MCACRICVRTDSDRISIREKNGVDLRKKGSGNDGNETKCTPVLWDGKPEELRCWGTALMCCGSSGCTHDLWEDSYGYDAVTFYVCRNGRGSWT